MRYLLSLLIVEDGQEVYRREGEKEQHRIEEDEAGDD
jgi:hypothetical protein